MRISWRTPALSRQRLAYPYIDTPLRSLLKRARCIDLRDNSRIENLGAGYARPVPLDPRRRWGEERIETPDA